MLLLVVPLAVGIVSGFVLRERKVVNLGRVTFGVILVLIFSLGFTIGSNNDLLASLPTVGLSAFVMAVLAIGFSVLFLVLIRRKVKL
jgi:hypothetical protein